MRKMETTKQKTASTKKETIAIIGTQQEVRNIATITIRYETQTKEKHQKRNNVTISTEERSNAQTRR